MEEQSIALSTVIYKLLNWLQPNKIGIKTANIKILSTHYKHRRQLPHLSLYQSVACHRPKGKKPRQLALSRQLSFNHAIELW